jgi:hypothetical protein
MKRFKRVGKLKLSVVLLAGLLLGSVSFVLLSSFIGLPNGLMKDAFNDVQINVGSYYPGMIDIVGASIVKDQSVLNATITVKEPIIALGEDESAKFVVIVILENDDDVLQTYELCIDFNATGIFGVAQDVQTETLQPVQWSVDGVKLTIMATLSELSEATSVQWCMYSVYEKLAGNQVVSSANDFFPDEGLRTTYFET